MKPFTESLRHEYPLTPDSVVLDIGGYEGNFAYEIARRYNCHVRVFEPVKEFYGKCVERLKCFPKVEVSNIGIADNVGRVNFKVSGDSTGQFSDNPQARDEEVELHSIYWVADGRGRGPDKQFYDLIKINAEGGEFAILEEMLLRGIVKDFGNIQVQPHTCVPGYEARWQRICERLAETHELEYAEPWCWFGWSLRK